MKKHIEKIIHSVYDIINSEQFKLRNRVNENDFVRNRKIIFPKVVLMIIKGFSKGLRHGIDVFLKDTKSEIESYSSVAFCKARQKIKPEAFKELSNSVALSFYENYKYRTYKGYRVFAIDGSDFNLPCNENTLEYFGTEKANCQSTRQVQGLCSCLYDTLNGIVFDAMLEPCKSNERVLAEKHIEYLKSYATPKDILIMDRGYPSFKLIKTLSESGIKYIMRCTKENFFKELKNANKPNQLIIRNNETIRVINIKKENKVITLLTNIFDEEIAISDFDYLYKLRWKIETKYDDLKTKYEIENFSSVIPTGILQDFYAVMFLSNFAACIEFDLRNEVEENNKNNNKKHEYKINTANEIRIIRENVIRLLIETRPRKTTKLLKNISKQITEYLLPVRPNRTFIHKKKHSCMRFFTNAKNF